VLTFPPRLKRIIKPVGNSQTNSCKNFLFGDAKVTKFLNSSTISPIFLTFPLLPNPPQILPKSSPNPPQILPKSLHPNLTTSQPYLPSLPHPGTCPRGQRGVLCKPPFGRPPTKTQCPSPPLPNPILPSIHSRPNSGGIVHAHRRPRTNRSPNQLHAHRRPRSNHSPNQLHAHRRPRTNRSPAQFHTPRKPSPHKPSHTSPPATTTRNAHPS